MRRVRIDVTQDDIDSGRPHDATSCPIAIAAARVLERPVFIAGVGIYASEDPDALAQLHALAQLPDRASAFVRDFDHGFVVEPFRFLIGL